MLESPCIALYRKGCIEQLTRHTLLLQARVLLLRDDFFCTINFCRCAFTSQHWRNLHLLESHGHSAPIKIMQAYVNNSFTTEVCHAELADTANIFFAVYYNDQPAGYSKIVLNTPHADVSLHPVTKLERLYLLTEFYDLKLGHKLLQQAFDRSKSAHDKRVWLDVWKGNDRALNFDEKQGFVAVGETSFPLTTTHANPPLVMLLAY